MSDIIIDTSVLTDIVLTTGPRHSDAKELGKYLNENQVIIRVPMHALFEVSSALKNEKMLSSPQKLQFWNELSEESPLRVKPVPIDEAFFKKYHSPDLPYMRAGDLIFVAMAKVDGAILITEDDAQYKKAKDFDVNAYRIRQFLDEFARR